MTLDVREIKAGLRRSARQLKRKLVHRVVNPARYVADLLSVRLGNVQTTNGTRTGPVRVLIVSDYNAFCSEEQLTAFSTFRRELRDKLRLVSLHLLLDDVLRAPRLTLSCFDIIVLKMSFRTSPAEALHVVRTIRDRAGRTPVIYFDGDDDLCVQWPNILSYLDLYVKKHAFSDKNNYLKRFVGKSNLHDYVYHKYSHSFTDRDYGNSAEGFTMITESGPVPAEQLSKIRVGYNLALDRHVIDLYKYVDRRLPQTAKENDVIFRGSVAQGNWSYHLRKDVEPILRCLADAFKVIIPNKRVPLEEYFHEMMSSRICVSPFGYGEICWRDFEAMLCGCLLIKPDMDHVETNPDVFRPYKTYVPVRWDFSDLEEKCKYYLTHERERQDIVIEAFRVLDEFYRNDGLIKFISGMLGACISAPSRGKVWPPGNNKVVSEA